LFSSDAIGKTPGERHEGRSSDEKARYTPTHVSGTGTSESCSDVV
jgi:hypothetical protein